MTDHAALLEAVEATAAGLPDAVTTVAGDSMTWSRRGTAFAVLRDASVELRVGMAIAAAARRTPDTTHSARGPEWVTFAPAELDDHALDRLGAWVAAAHRRTEG